MTLKNYKKLYFILTAIILTFAGCTASNISINNSSNTALIIDTVKAQKFDTGKMWTFDYPPFDYFSETYGFRPTQQWFDDVRKASLKFANYCSASFISKNGLIMTNDHCGETSVTQVSKDGENLPEKGFYAEKLEDERPVEGLFVEQLILIKDVTREVQDAIDAGKTSEEKSNNKAKKIAEISSKYRAETKLECSVVSLYNGGKYSLYGVKRYNDVRLVFSPETSVGFFGGDYDNFTYPRYNLDVTFFRVYDDSGKPLKTENYFKWSENGAYEGEPLFAVGNPGRTNRLKTISQLEYFRDIAYPVTLSMLNGAIEAVKDRLENETEHKAELRDNLQYLANSQKVYAGMISGLHDPYMMARKKDFEKTFKAAVDANPKLKNDYGDAWENIAEIRAQLKKLTPTLSAYSLNPLLTSDYFNIAKEVILLAKQLKLPENERLPEYQGEQLDSTKLKIFRKDFSKRKNDILLRAHADLIINLLGNQNELVQKLFGNKTGKAAADYILNNSKIATKESLAEFLKKSPDEILNSDDPFIYFILNTEDKLKELRAKQNELITKEETYNQKIGRALFEVYGTSIPPDATFTLRISDGVIKDYDYNGTKAPTKTTFYGMYDRYYSFEGKNPWNLPDRWKNPPAEFDLSVPFNFITTHDLTGGASGSPVINKNMEIVGIAFDGNIESLNGDFLFDTKTNRSINVASQGMMECLKDIYKADRLVKELKGTK